MNLLYTPVAFFTSLRAKAKTRRLSDILTEIKEGRYAWEITAVRQPGLSDDERKARKRRLPAFMVSGTSKGGHKARDFDQHSGFLQIDIDHLSDFAEAVVTREKLAADAHVLACWISPGGKGVKAIVPINADHQTHKANFASAQRHFQEKHRLSIDPRCSDPGRLCFVSHDPDLVLKDSADSFPGEPVSTQEPKRGANEEPPPGSSTLTSSTPYQLHHTVFSEYEGLSPLYRNLVWQRIRKVSSGLRNDALVEVVPVLCSAIAPKFITVFAEELYSQHEGVFRDPLAQHLMETHALINGCLRDFAAKRLTGQEAQIYSQLNERQQTVFRICHALSGIQNEDCPPPYFFLSAEKLGHRLGALDAVAHRDLRKLCALGVLRIKQVGTRRVKGQPGRATHYEWLLPTRAHKMADD